MEPHLQEVEAIHQAVEATALHQHHLVDLVVTLLVLLPRPMELHQVVTVVTVHQPFLHPAMVHHLVVQLLPPVMELLLQDPPVVVIHLLVHLHPVMVLHHLVVDHNLPVDLISHQWFSPSVLVSHLHLMEHLLLEALRGVVATQLHQNHPHPMELPPVPSREVPVLPHPKAMALHLQSHLLPQAAMVLHRLLLLNQVMEYQRLPLPAMELQLLPLLVMEHLQHRHQVMEHHRPRQSLQVPMEHPVSHSVEALHHLQAMEHPLRPQEAPMEHQLDPQPAMEPLQDHLPHMEHLLRLHHKAMAHQCLLHHPAMELLV